MLKIIVLLLFSLLIIKTADAFLLLGAGSSLPPVLASGNTSFINGTDTYFYNGSDGYFQ
jgi:hypothetical protein